MQSKTVDFVAESMSTFCSYSACIVGIPTKNIGTSLTDVAAVHNASIKKNE